MQNSSPYQDEPTDYINPETIQDKIEPSENDLPTIKNNCKSSQPARHIIEDRRHNLAADLW